MLGHGDCGASLPCCPQMFCHVVVFILFLRERFFPQATESQQVAPPQTQAHPDSWAWNVGLGPMTLTQMGVVFSRARTTQPGGQLSKDATAQHGPWVSATRGEVLLGLLRQQLAPLLMGPPDWPPGQSQPGLVWIQGLCTMSFQGAGVTKAHSPGPQAYILHLWPCHPQIHLPAAPACLSQADPQMTPSQAQCSFPSALRSCLSPRPLPGKAQWLWLHVPADEAK